VSAARTGAVACALLLATAAVRGEEAPPIVELSPPAVVTVAAGGRGTVELHLTIDEAHHVMANPASSDFLVPLEVVLTGAEGISMGAVSYPEAVPFPIADGDTLATYAGEVVLELPIAVAVGTAPGERRLRGSLEYQGCNRFACRVPETVEWEATIVVE